VSPRLKVWKVLAAANATLVVVLLQFDVVNVCAVDGEGIVEWRAVAVTVTDFAEVNVVILVLVSCVFVIVTEIIVFVANCDWGDASASVAAHNHLGVDAQLSEGALQLVVLVSKLPEKREREKLGSKPTTSYFFSYCAYCVWYSTAHTITASNQALSCFLSPTLLYYSVYSDYTANRTGTGNT
jgi:hypothetical protein